MIFPVFFCFFGDNSHKSVGDFLRCDNSVLNISYINITSGVTTSALQIIMTVSTITNKLPCMFTEASQLQYLRSN